MLRGLSFVAHHLDQISYALDRMAGRFNPSSILMLSQFFRTTARVRGNTRSPIRIAPRVCNDTRLPIRIAPIVHAHLLVLLLDLKIAFTLRLLQGTTPPALPIEM